MIKFWNKEIDYIDNFEYIGYIKEWKLNIVVFWYNNIYIIDYGIVFLSI